MTTPTPPESYSSLPFRDITISHVPPSSPTPTKVLLLTLNRPKAFNAATAQMTEELLAAYQYFEADDRVKAIVLTGAGKAFCAGADLNIGFSSLLEDIKKDPSVVDTYRDAGGKVALAIHHSSKPTIAAINGPAAGFGITLTLPCAIRLATASAKISFPFARRGLTMEACSSFFLPRLLGTSRAMHVLTTGDTYPASHPLLGQLFSEVLPSPEDTVTRALEIAGKIAGLTSTVSGAVMRDLVYRGVGSAEEAHLVESKLFLGMVSGRDCEEGMRSFMERREPVFKGVARDGVVGWPWWREEVRARGAKL